MISGRGVIVEPRIVGVAMPVTQQQSLGHVTVQSISGAPHILGDSRPAELGLMLVVNGLYGGFRLASEISVIEQRLAATPPCMRQESLRDGQERGDGQVQASVGEAMPGLVLLFGMPGIRQTSDRQNEFAATNHNPTDWRGF